ncbi:MAG TPA: dihydrolipoyl dehydrogenase [Terriglobia bacterium]|nr:dihydrolipoyl dehydrogenase [Terriglobia bacterium]
MTDQSPFDVAIIGSGPGGYVAAIRAGQLGLKTAVIEKDSRYGGTCLLRGCIPTKALLRDAHLFQEIKRAKQQGLFKIGDIEIDFAKIQDRKNDIVDKNAKGVEFLFRKNKVTVIKGYGTVVSPTRIAVKGEGSTTEVDAKNIIVATGSEAKSLPGYNFDEKLILSNVGVLELKNIPKSMFIVGCGAVGVEFASIFNSFGTKVTLLEVAANIVPLEDEEVSKELKRVFTKKGIEVYTKGKLESAQPKDGGVEVTFQTEKGEAKKYTVEKLLMATGRGPNTASIGLDKLGVAMERGFVKVSPYMETSVKGVYAIGDVTPSPLLAHVASQEGIIAVEKIAGKHPVPMKANQIPGCTYCDPQVASVGLTEAKAKEAGHNVKVGKFPFTAVAKAKIEDAPEGFVKIVADAKYGEILGVHMVGNIVTEIISEAVAAMALEATVEDLVNTIHAHPTLAEATHEASEAVFGAAIHI